MSVLRVRLVGEGVLRKRSHEIVDPDVWQKTIDSMLDTVRSSEKAVALAAPQIGHLARLFVFAENSHAPRVYINPVIHERLGEVLVPEGCLSIPGFYPLIRRAERVRGIAMNRWGDAFEFDEVGLLGHAVQHEVDHLEGVLMIDRMSGADREALLQHIPPELYRLRKGIRKALAETR